MERVAGIEPASRAWMASALPLSYTCLSAEAHSYLAATPGSAPPALWQSVPEKPIADCLDGRHRFFSTPNHSKIMNPKKRSEEHTSELQSLMRISYAVFCLKNKKRTKPN